MSHPPICSTWDLRLGLRCSKLCQLGSARPCSGGWKCAVVRRSSVVEVRDANSFRFLLTLTVVNHFRFVFWNVTPTSANHKLVNSSNARFNLALLLLAAIFLLILRHLHWLNDNVNSSSTDCINVSMHLVGHSYCWTSPSPTEAPAFGGRPLPCYESLAMSMVLLPDRILLLYGTRPLIYTLCWPLFLFSAFWVAARGITTDYGMGMRPAQISRWDVITLSFDVRWLKRY